MKRTIDGEPFPKQPKTTENLNVINDNIVDTNTKIKNTPIVDKLITFHKH